MMYQNNKKRILLPFLLLGLLATVQPIVAIAQDSTKTSEVPKAKLKPFKNVIKPGTVSVSGLFTVHFLNDKYFLEIPNSLLGKDMLLVSRLSKTPRGIKNGGEQLNENVLQWERVEDKLFLRFPSYSNVITRDSSIHEALLNSNVSPIYADFNILSENKEKNSVLIEITSLVKGDDLAFGLSEMLKKTYQIGAIDMSKSYINHIKSHPTNIEILTTKTYKAANTFPATEGGGKITLEIHNSIILLPENPMMPRLEDKRVGYFAQQQSDYGLNDQRVEKTTYIRRWRLEPKDPQAYFAGKLSEPIKPIVFYIDPATPAKWVPFLKEGVEDWNKAFEAAGFKNAIMAKEAPSHEEDSTWSVNDTRFSVIRYLASETENAYGPHVADPRTGEIISSHIGWYHNVMSLISNWYFTLTGAVNPESRNRVLDDKVMGKLIRYIAAHEVGHTLGLPHNFISSSAYAVDSLRSKSFTDKYGTTPSIMDYARFNYIAQPEDNVQNLMPQIGPYDEYNINWGYRNYQNILQPQDELPILNKLIVDKKDDPIYRYSKQLTMFERDNDPRSQTEDLGDNPMLAGEYGIKNLQKILPNLHKWSYKEGDNYDFVANRYNRIYAQWSNYISHAQQYIGGVFEDHKSMDQAGAIYSPAPADKQVEAIAFLHKHVFTTPNWLMDPEMVDKLQGTKIIEKVARTQSSILVRLVNLGNFNRLDEWYIRSGGKGFSVPQLLSLVSEGLFNPDIELDSFRRSLQRLYIQYLSAYSLSNLNNAAFDADRSSLGLKTFPKESDYPLYTSEALMMIKNRIKKLKNKGDKLSKAHYEDLLTRIE